LQQRFARHLAPMQNDWKGLPKLLAAVRDWRFPMALVTSSTSSFGGVEEAAPPWLSCWETRVYGAMIPDLGSGKPAPDAFQ